MTIEFNKAKEYSGKDKFNNLDFGTPVYLMPKFYKMDNNAVAIIPACIPSSKQLGITRTPHITLAVAPGTSPVYSNELLKTGNYQEITKRIVLEAYLTKIVSGIGPVPKIAEFADDVYG